MSLVRKPFAVAALSLAGGMALCLATAGPARSQDKPAADAHPVLKKLGALVGGKWVTEFKSSDGVPFGEMRFTWSDGGKTVGSQGVLGQGTPNVQQVRAYFSYDPASKKVYYLDMHGPETVFFGHVRLDGETLVYEFKSIVGKPAEWLIHETIEGNACKSTMWQVVDGKKSEKPMQINLKRVE